MLKHVDIQNITNRLVNGIVLLLVMRFTIQKNIVKIANIIERLDAKMVRDLYDVIKDNLRKDGTISEECIIEIVGIYGLSLLHFHELLDDRGIVRGKHSYYLKPIEEVDSNAVLR